MSAKSVSTVVEGVPPRTLASLRRLPVPVLRRLQGFVESLLRERAADRKKDLEGQQFFPTMLSGAVVPRLRYVKCGKDSCSCAAGKLHGPYWYAEWRTMDGKKHTRYVGKIWSMDKVKDLLLQNVPMKRMGLPEDVAQAVVFFASDLSKYITGQVLVVDGGMTM